VQCPSCDYEALQTEFGEPMRCPECGAYYEKAVALKLRKETAAKTTGQSLTLGDIAAKVDSTLRSAVDFVTPAAGQLKQGLDGARQAVEVGRATRAYGKLYCPSCGSVNNGKRHVPGSIWIELVLWLFFLVPGLIYSIWRLASAKQACCVCQTPGLIPKSSPRAQRELGS
jgi:hypothetical protein